MSAYISEYERRFPTLTDLMGYFNLSWKHLFDWGAAEPTFESVVRHYNATHSTIEIEQVRRELEQLLSLSLGEEDLRAATEQMNAAYYPPSTGKTYHQWLNEVLTILKEPQHKARAMRIIS